MKTEPDTIKLLRECDAGIKMGITSIDEVMEYIKNDNFRKILLTYKNEHVKLENEIQDFLNICHDDGKNPSPMAKSMSWMKINAKLVMNESDQTIADLITDGCNMGVKSLNRYLNQYQASDEKSKDITKRIIKLEENFAMEMRKFL